MEDILPIVISNLSFKDKFKCFMMLNTSFRKYVMIKRIPDAFMNEINNKNIQELVNLTSLNLIDNKIITNEGIQGLANLTNLNLRFNKIITNKGIQGLTKLTNLDLRLI